MFSRKLRLTTIQRVFLPVLISIVLVFSAGCQSIPRPVQTSTQSETILNSENAVGQSFVSNFGGLEGIRYHLENREPGDGEIILHLRASATDLRDLASARLPLETITTASYYTFTFPEQGDSQRKSYYVYLDLAGSGEVAISTAQADTYLDGAEYINGKATEGQLAFMLIHDPVGMAAGLVVVGLEWFKLLAIGCFLFLPPGWALLKWLYPRWSSLTWIEKTCLSIGASLTLYPLLMLLTNIVGLKLGALYAWLPPILGLLLIAFLWWRKRNSSIQAAKTVNSTDGSHAKTSRIHLADLAFIAATALLIFSRLWPVHNIDAPLWGDSYQHTVIAQLLVDQRGLFDSWEPFAPISTFTYHFGFHTAIAAYHWIGGDEMFRLTLWVGQIMNIMAVLALVPLSMRIGRSRWAAALTVIAAGLFAPMPMYYLNWGRYTQLAGQVVLPVFIYLIWSALSDRNDRRTTAILAGVLAAGLALNHYLVLIFAVGFTIAALPFALRRGWTIEPLIRLALAGSIGGLLFLPRFLQVFSGSIFAVTGAQYTADPSGSPAIQPIEWTTYLPVLLWILLIAGFLWAILRRDRLGIILGLLWGLLFVAANPARLGFPFNGALSVLAVMITFYIPAGVLSGALGGWLAEKVSGWRLSQKQRLAAGLGFAIILIAAGAFGARTRLSDLNVPVHALMTRPDLQAMEWIEMNTPEDSVFLVNSILSFGGSASAGTDGGWWIPYFTGRQTTQPPMNYGQEKSSIPGYHYWLVELTDSVTNLGLDDPHTVQLLREWDVSYVYIGQQQGTVNFAVPSLHVDEIRRLEWAELVYHQDRVWIFKLDLERVK